MTSLTKLLSCPFCGGDAAWQSYHPTNPDGEPRVIGCCDDECFGPRTTATGESAIVQWNTRSGRLRVSDELDAATVERCARELEEFLEAESGAEYGMMSDFDRSALRARNRETQEYISAIRSLIPNSAGDARTTHLQGEGEPVVKQVPSPAETVSEKELSGHICWASGSSLRRALCDKLARALLSQFDVRRRK